MPKAKVYDKGLVRVKHSDVINYITDKSIIKDGMIVKIDGKYYVKIGYKLCRIDIENPLSFDSLKQEDIQMVFKSNGKTIVEVKDDK